MFTVSYSQLTKRVTQWFTTREGAEKWCRLVGKRYLIGSIKEQEHGS